jgi:hypothetical protein
MGRPRKRRRDGEANGHDVQPTEVDGSPIYTNDLSVLGNFGIVTPPQFNDAIYPVVSAGMGHGIELRQNSMDSTVHGISPVSGIEYVAPYNYIASAKAC